MIENKEIKTYQVTGTNFDEKGNIRFFDVNIKGADFRIDRVYNNFKPTKIFKFNKTIEFIEKENRTVEIDWDTSQMGLLQLAEQMELKLIPGASVFKNGGKSYFMEVEA